MIRISLLILLLFPFDCSFVNGATENDVDESLFTEENKLPNSKRTLWNPPTLPISNLFYSPCNFPLFSFSQSSQKRNHHHREVLKYLNELKLLSILEATFHSQCCYNLSWQ
jgi:hypothetical protein